MLDILNGLAGAGCTLFFVCLAVASFQEHEYRAVWISLVLAAISGIVLLLVIPASSPVLQAASLLILLAFAILSMLRFFPGQPEPRCPDTATQYDERDTMFARNTLKNHPELKETYYRMRPENEAIDRQIHNKPDFGDARQTFHDEYTAPVYLSAFGYLEATIPISDGAPAPDKKQIDPARFVNAMTQMVRFYGGCDTGILATAPHHYYSHKGRHAKDWGTPPDQSYPTAIVIVVPMRPEMLKQGPTSSVIQESAQKYVEAAKISNILALYIRQFGYRARAHNDANYETLCVPMAVESGLGELGRMGIFMHRIHGPCVRLAVVTTDLILPPTVPGPPLHMEAFCRICKKCADNCPSASITRGDEQQSRGFRHWSIDQARCFSYWKTIGSDCGMCIAVCPYTKPDTLIHRLVRFYISRNPVNQRIALIMDDLLYGRKKPLPKSNPATIFRS